MMHAATMLVTAALCAGMLAGCDKAKEPAGSSTTAVPPPQQSGGPTTPPAFPTATTSMPNKGPQLSTKGTTPPIQGQVDTRQAEQRRDFETKKP